MQDLISCLGTCCVFSSTQSDVGGAILLFLIVSPRRESNRQLAH